MEKATREEQAHESGEMEKAFIEQEVHESGKIDDVFTEEEVQGAGNMEGAPTKQEGCEYGMMGEAIIKEEVYDPTEIEGAVIKEEVHEMEEAAPEGLVYEAYLLEDGLTEAMDLGIEDNSDSQTEESDLDDVDPEDQDCRAMSDSSSDFSDLSIDFGDVETLGDKGWTSRSKEIQWAPTNAKTSHYSPEPMRMNPGPTRHAIARISSLEDTFDLYLTDKIMGLILQSTNLQGRRTVKGWKDIDATDLRAYIGLLLLSGVYRSRNETMMSLWNDHTGRSIFRATMSIKTFRLINSCLRFEDKQSRQRRQKGDKMAQFRDIWDMWTARLPLLFNPGKDICVDEMMVSYRGRCSFRQYIPRKPAKYGIKIWVTSDVETSYAWKMSVYTGKEADVVSEKNQGTRVALEMTQGLRGVTVTCDSFFTSYALAEELLKKKIALVGAIRRSKPELPPQLLDIRQREIKTSKFAFTKTHTAVSYIPKRGKNLILLSTKHREPSVGKKDKRTPLIIHDYNRCKGSVDTLDKLISTYSCRRRTKWWPLVLFYNLLDVSACNAFVLWSTVDPSWHQGKTYRRRLFIEELGKSLINPQMSRRQRLPRSSVAASMVTGARLAEGLSFSNSDIPSRRGACVMCTSHRHRVYSTCSRCGNHVCKKHYRIVCNMCYD